MNLPYDEQFAILYQSGNGLVRRHFLVDINATDYQLLENIAKEKAQQEMRVDIMPTLGNIDDPLRKIIFPDAIYAKSPDPRINGILYEVEHPTKPTKQNNLSHAIGAGASQAHYLIIIVNHPIGYQYMARVSKGRFKLHKELQVIEFRYNSDYQIFTRK